ncbi:hypothetical protein Nepgr_012478 [Nepenthes gracilis]|uniref:Uncharacterized protein n=1 Tax=Nepenthes gracilis TaxID=150966 RepID=A0AAD3SHD0_NEPGR|nr:hypothetical protein Nepgr_012478 [Nepenthes gracilis]
MRSIVVSCCINGRSCPGVAIASLGGFDVVGIDWLVQAGTDHEARFVFPSLIAVGWVITPLMRWVCCEPDWFRVSIHVGSSAIALSPLVSEPYAGESWAAAARLSGDGMVVCPCPMGSLSSSLPLNDAKGICFFLRWVLDVWNWVQLWTREPPPCSWNAPV